MSGNVPTSTEPSSLGSTKQLLDELDALMEKMLALPVEQAPASIAMPEELKRLPKVSATLTVVEPPADSALSSGPRLDGVAALPEPHADFANKQRQPDPEAASYFSVQDNPSLTSGPEGIPLDAVPPALLQVKIPEVSVLPLAARTAGALLLQPLMWINGIFDLGTRFLGPFGRWLRTGQGRNVLGGVGVLLIVLAVAWVVLDVMSWTQ